MRYSSSLRPSSCASRRRSVSCILAKDAEDTGVRAQCLQISFRQLANTHYIKQVVSFYSTLPW